VKKDSDSSAWSNTQSVDIFWEMEPNNYYTQSTQISGSGQNVYGLPNDAKDFYSVYMPTNGWINVTLTNPGSGTQLQLFYESTSDLKASDWESPYQVGYNGQAGWYYIYIYKPPPYNTTTVYTLKVTYPSGLTSKLMHEDAMRSRMPM
jgi:hypothetical protein